MIDTFLRRMSRLLAAIAGIALFLMMAQTVADVIADNFFGKPIMGNLEVISVYHMVLVVFLPLALVEWKHENIQVDLFFLMMPARLQRVVLVLGYLICAAFFAMLARQTAIDALASKEKNELMMAAVYIVIWPAKFALPAGFAAITLVTLRHAIRALRDPIGSFAPQSDEAHI
ncbi:MAG: TRAP transporter small permease [Pikeienuella sp.]